MVCPRCTLLHADAVLTCRQCGYQFRSLLQDAGAIAVRDAQLKIGVIAGGTLFGCLTVALLSPGMAGPALSYGACFGIASIGNSWVANLRDDAGDLLRGTRGLIFSLALLYSLLAELARLQGYTVLPVPSLPGVQVNVPVPSALVTEFLACVLIVLDPLVASPLVRWIGEGAEQAPQEQRALR